MKKLKFIFLSIVLIIGVFSLSACNFLGNRNSTTVDRAWADNEILTYNIYEEDNKIGNLTMDLTSNLTEQEKNDNKDADSKLTTNLVTTNQTINTVYYIKRYTVLSYTKQYTDLKDSKNNYTINAKHKGQEFSYTLTYPNDSSKNKTNTLKTKAAYSDGEFMYYYVRCFSTTTSFDVANPLTDSVVTLSTTGLKAATIKTDFVDFGSVACTGYSFSLNGTPSGSNIFVYYTPVATDYTRSISASILSSVKFPATIFENTYKYVLSGVTLY